MEIWVPLYTSITQFVQPIVYVPMKSLFGKSYPVSPTGVDLNIKLNNKHNEKWAQTLTHRAQAIKFTTDGVGWNWLNTHCCGRGKHSQS